MLRRWRDSARADSKAVLKTRLSTMGAAGRRRKSEMADAPDTSGTLSGKRDCAKAHATDTSDDLPLTQEKRRRVSDLQSALFADERRGPKMKEHWDANHASPVARVNAAISGWAAEECSRASGQELSEEGEKLHGGIMRAAKES